MKRITHVIIIQLLILCINANAQQADRLSQVTCIPVNADQTYYFTLDTIGNWTYATGCLFGAYNGEEKVLRFTASCTNVYQFEFIEPVDPAMHPISIRNSTGSCTPGGFTCMNPVSTVYLGGPFRIIYEFSAFKDSTYDILVEYDYWAINPPSSNLSATIKTPHVQDINFFNINPDSISLSWTGVFDDVILEYGPNGFIPGQDTTSGTFGNVVIGITSPYTLIGLSNDSSYSFYLRDRCGSNYSGNSVATRIRIPQPDSMIVQINSCPNSTFSGKIYGSYILKPCSWLSVNCGTGCPQSSPEIIKKFIPDSSGYYILSKTIGAGVPYNTYGSFFKETTLGLNEYNWNCIGEGGEAYPWSLSFGPLVAGTPYYILVKSTQDLGNCNSPPLLTRYFQIECQGSCPILPNHSINSPTTNSLTFRHRQGNTLGYFVIEYGLAGFTPGTDTLPGIGGTIFTTFGTYSDLIFSGLLPGTTYDFYLRQYCDITGSFSPNSTVRSGTTYPLCSVAPSAITTNRAGNAVCTGQSITLTQIGGMLSQGASFKWYRDSCGSSPIGTGNSITVFPDSSRIYFVRPIDTCAIIPCTQILVTVNPLPQVSLSNPPLQEICLGDTVILQATIDSSWTYTWKRNGVNLNAPNLSTYNAFSGGIYSVSVIDSNVCTKTSQNSSVRIICFPPQDPIERISIDEVETNNSIVVVPNPGNGLFNCYFPKQTGACRLSVYNSIGLRVMESKVNGESGHASIDISNQPTGLYELIVESSTQILSQKIFVVDK